MTGAVPNTSWLDRCVVLDEHGFIKTGSELSQDDLAAAGWRLQRAPYLLETSRPGVFAVGDVRAETSSASRPPPARDELLSPAFIRCFTNKTPTTLKRRKHAAAPAFAKGYWAGC